MPGRARLDQKGRDARGARLGRLGPGHDGEEAGPGRIGDEALGAVQQIALALAPRAGGEARGIRAALRLGQAEGADDLAGGQARQIAALLRLGAVDQDAQRADADIGAEERAEGRRGLAELEGDMHLVDQAEPEPAILRRGGEAEQPQPPHLLDDALGNRIGLGDRALLRHQPLPHETAHRLYELLAAQAVERHPAAFIRRLPGFAARPAAEFRHGLGAWSDDTAGGRGVNSAECRFALRKSRGARPGICRLSRAAEVLGDAVAGLAARASPAPRDRRAIGGSGSRSCKR